ncbi:putative regulator of Ras-like GTPase activity (Roadblock/LC7/MglB family) [Streptomyces sp. B3I7]|nr:putative regulator of Ras-like GTPase activity (Roadblock/LC7/MglB family) [Streptomyces sp. B3I8]MDQ0813022.1 putative regulator of Ras-like GTPase activity (Roadblock/LC7/MglB family) [Streptomyces sp. B3I7]
MIRTLRQRAERRLLMAAEAEVLDELRRLRARVPQLTGALAASVDGLVLAHDTPGVEPEGVAALTAASLGVAVRMTDATAQGDFRELLVRGVYGYVATYAAGRSAVVTLLAQDRVNVGRLHLEGRRASTRIGELVDSAAARAEAASPPPAEPPRTLPAKPPMRTPAKPATARARTARTPADAPHPTANARTKED